MIPFPNGKYSVIYADPPWRYSDRKCNGNAEDHYPTMKLEDICNLPVKDLAADNCVLFLWASEIEDFPIAVTKYHFPEEVPDE